MWQIETLETVQNSLCKSYVCEHIEETRSNLTELQVEDIVDRAIDSYKLNFGGDDFHYFNYGNRYFRNRPARASTSKTLTVTNVDLKVKANGRAHRTDRFEISKSKINPLLVVRRGHAFSVDVKLSRAYDEKVDDLKIIFSAGRNPNIVTQTFILFTLSAQSVPKKWGAKITNIQGNVLTLDIFTPPTCYIGKWNLMIDVIKKQESKTNVLRYQHKDPIYVIFNPWCQDDSVYMSNQQYLDEYVLNEAGVLYMGSSNFDVVPRPWNYGQFESCVLDVAMYLLDICGLDWENRGNPVLIARKISASVNHHDEGGILFGMWGKHYPGGTHPTEWTGSVGIIKKYWSTKQAVLYGQCWVFSGVTTTICRALGIPVRCITNYNSSHDTDGSITINLFFNAKGELERGEGKDSYWNFHCWNECYMTRPDLPSGYGGWQAFDGTPQETSDGVFQCGPIPVSAIKNGDVHMPYDGPFVFSEVNGDVYFWKPNKKGEMEMYDYQTNASGTLIVTKSIGSDAHEDLTLTYKHPEDSPEERDTVLKVKQRASSTRYTQPQKLKFNQDVTFTVIQDISKNSLGEPFSVGLKVKNTSTSKRTASGQMLARSVYHTGAHGDLIKIYPFKNIALNAGEEKQVTLLIQPEEYIGKLLDLSIIDVIFMSEVDENNQKFAIKRSYSLHGPQIIITAPSEATMLKELTIELSFTNPLNLSLSNCVVVVDGICPAVKIPLGNVAAKENFRTSVRVTPSRTGTRELIAVFNSNNLKGVNGSLPITIVK